MLGAGNDENRGPNPGGSTIFEIIRTNPRGFESSRKRLNRAGHFVIFKVSRDLGACSSLLLVTLILKFCIPLAYN